MAEKRSRKYREKVKCSICKKKFNSDSEDKHSETIHRGQKVDFSCVLEEGQSLLAFTPKRTRTEDPISAGPSRLALETAAPVDCDENEPSDEPGYGKEKDTDAIPCEHDTPPGNSSENVQVTVEDAYLVGDHDDTLDAPKQPILKSYDPRKFGNDIYTRDFNADWYNDHPWLEYSVEAKTASCYACKTYIGKNFTFSNWKKPERLMKHHKSQDLGVDMAKCYCLL